MTCERRMTNMLSTPEANSKSNSWFFVSAARRSVHERPGLGSVIFGFAVLVRGALFLNPAIAQDNEKASPSNVHKAMCRLRSTSQCTCIKQLATRLRWACRPGRQYLRLHSMTDWQLNPSAEGCLNRNGVFAYGPSSGRNGFSGVEVRVPSACSVRLLGGQAGGQSV